VINAIYKIGVMLTAMLPGLQPAGLSPGKRTPELNLY
jgi:hypothetical protein